MNASNATCLMALALSLLLPAHAGAWGEGAYDNDAAQEWLAECARSADAAVVSEAIELALVASHVDADDGAAAVAAAEAIAGALARNGGGTGGAVLPCLSRTPPEGIRALAPQARQAVARVADPAVSELARQWAEEKGARWAEHLRRLVARLSR